MDIKGTLDIGSTLGEFVIERFLGRGGMGVVYKAHEPSLNRKVALKVLSSMLSSDEEYIARFKKEAQIIAALNHPNIVHILTFGYDSGHYFFAMEYIKGGDLEQRLKEKTIISIEEALSICRQIANALSEAGSKGVVHRDLKPSNIMIDSMNRVRVTDFGIARLNNSIDGLTKTGMLLGTPEYASPEQATGQPIDTRSDIYALGALIYRILSGKPPVVGDSPLAVFAKIATEPVTPIGLLNASVPKPVCDLINKMMARDLRDRFQTPEEVCAALDACEKMLKEAKGFILAPLTEGISNAFKVMFPRTIKGRKTRIGPYWTGALLSTAGFLAFLYFGDGLQFPPESKMSVQGAHVSAPAVEVAPSSPQGPMAPAEDEPTDTAKTAQDTLETTSPPKPDAGSPPAGRQPATLEAPPTKAHSFDKPAGNEMKPSPGIQQLAPMPTPPTASKASMLPKAPATLKESKAASPALGSRQAEIVKESARSRSPSVLILVTGTEEISQLMRPYLESAIEASGLRPVSLKEIPAVSEKTQFGQTPASWEEIKTVVPDGTVDILMLATIQKTATTVLKFFGTTQQQVTAVYSIRTLDMDTGEAVNRTTNGQLKFTDSNHEKEFQNTVGDAARNLCNFLSDYCKARSGKTPARDS